MDEHLAVDGREDSATAQSPIRWSFIHFMADGSYRAARREAADTGDGQGEKEPVTGRWAVVSTQTRGSLLCTRALLRRLGLARF